MPLLAADRRIGCGWCFGGMLQICFLISRPMQAKTQRGVCLLAAVSMAVTNRQSKRKEKMPLLIQHKSMEDLVLIASNARWHWISGSCGGIAHRTDVPGCTDRPSHTQA